MKRFLVLLLLLCGVSAFGAAGDYYGAQIDSQGWQLWLQFNQMNTNGTFAFGFGTNSSISGNEKVKVILTSQGYDNTGTATTRSRTLYGTKEIRFPYNANGQHMFPDVASNSPANITMIKVALSDYVYSSDSNITVTLGSGLYSTNSVNSAAASAVPVTNNSTLVYPSPVGNWSWVPWNTVGSNYTQRIVAFDAYGVACVKCVSSDGTTSFTNIQTAPQIDHTLPDKAPVTEYLFPMSSASMTQGGVLKQDFIIYPKVGSNVLTTFDGLNINMAFYSTRTNICDRLGTFGQAAAVVATNGVDATGVVVTNFNPASPPSPFLTLAAARNAILLTNNAKFNRKDTGNSIIYLTNGAYVMWGAAPTTGDTNRTWLTIAPFPGISKWSASLTTPDGNYFKWDSRTHVTNIFLNSTAALDWSGEKDIWFDQCAFNVTQTTYLQSAIDNVYFTQCLITNFVNGFIAQSTKNIAFPLIRGNDLTGQQAYQGMIYTVLGNGADTYAAPLNKFKWVTTFSGTTAPVPSNNIVFAYNYTMSWSNDGSTWIAPEVCTNNAAFVGNLFEGCSSNTTAQGPYLWASTTPCTNVLILNNSFVGARIATFYNDGTGGTDAVAIYRPLCFMNGNETYNYNIKTDTFTGSTQNGARVGNWACMYGVGWSDNYFPEIGGMGASGSFLNEFLGLNSYRPATSRNASGMIISSLSTNTIFSFVNAQCWDGITSHGGGGNYRKQSKSAEMGVSQKAWTAFDLEANNRGNFDPCGAYASASPRKGAGFFQ